MTTTETQPSLRSITSRSDSRSVAPASLEPPVVVAARARAEEVFPDGDAPWEYVPGIVIAETRDVDAIGAVAPWLHAQIAQQPFFQRARSADLPSASARIVQVLATLVGRYGPPTGSALRDAWMTALRREAGSVDADG